MYDPIIGKYVLDHWDAVTEVVRCDLLVRQQTARIMVRNENGVRCRTPFFSALLLLRKDP